MVSRRPPKRRHEHVDAIYDFLLSVIGEHAVHVRLRPVVPREDQPSYVDVVCTTQTLLPRAFGWGGGGNILRIAAFSEANSNHLSEVKK